MVLFLTMVLFHLQNEDSFVVHGRGEWFCFYLKIEVVFFSNLSSEDDYYTSADGG